MNFFLFAAGLGKRLRPLTLTTPKPLIYIHQQTLLGRLLEQILPHADTIFINISWLGEQIEQFISQHYSKENIIILKEQHPLETGGTLLNALNLPPKHPANALTTQPFVTINSDIYTSYDFSTLRHQASQLSSTDLAHLILVDCPAHRQQGDFHLKGNKVSGTIENRGNLVYSGIGIIHPDLLRNYHKTRPKTAHPTIFSLSEALYYASVNEQLTGEHYLGTWHDVGTLESLQTLKALDHNHSHLCDDNAPDV